MRSWLLDLYPGRPGEMVVWMKSSDGRTTRLTDAWLPSMFASADNLSDLDVPLRTMSHDFADIRRVEKYEQILDLQRSTVVEAKVCDAKKTLQVAQRLERMAPFGDIRLYNVDVPPAQSYLYEKDIFPLGCCGVESKGGRLEWTLLDDAMACDYPLPDLTYLKVDLKVKKEGKLPRFTDRLEEVTLETEGRRESLSRGDEAETILDLVKAVKAADPDFILTADGDTFLFPYLIGRAEANGVSSQLTLDREGTTLRVPQKEGRSYFSYGKILYKPSSVRLYGRVHIDENSSFAFSEAGFQGLFELSRDCRMPMHTSSRASIGKALSSLQFYFAHKRGLLVPWKPTLAEHPKSWEELLIGDRGGLILDPMLGLHEQVGELDFSSLYPSIMLRKNISAETVHCKCCPDSKNRVPELRWRVCERRKGIVPKAMEVIVTKRLRYKELRRVAEGTPDCEKYDARQAVLKWLGVTSFGYLGFNNAKFGRIDAHMAVCAWDREILMQASDMAEERGFTVIHGIIDSLWVKREGATEQDFLDLRRDIEEKTGFPLSFEGVYKWVAFLASKASPKLPVLNRYFGVYASGKLKVRGIEARRHDTPLAFVKCQMEVLRVLGEADTAEEAKKRVPECLDVFLKWVAALESHEIPPEELAFTTNLSKDPSEYKAATIQRAALQGLLAEGVKLRAGQGMRYVITRYSGRGSVRATPLDTIGSREYDSRRYIELLARVCSSVLEVFDASLTEERLAQLSVRGTSQMTID